MTSPSISLTEQMVRRRPVIGAPVAHGASDHLKRSIGTFQLTMFGVGATVGTGIFFVLSTAVPEAGPGVIVSFLIAGLAAGLAAICYAEMASAVPVSGSTYSYAYTTLGEFVAMGVAACLLLEYGVSTAAVAVGWSQYLSKLLENIFHVALPHAISAAPWDAVGEGEPHGWINLPAVILVAMCALLLIRGASESAKGDMVSIGTLTAFIVVSIGVIVLRVREPDLPRGFKGQIIQWQEPGEDRHHDCVQRLGGGRVDLLSGVESPPQRAQRRW